MRSPSQRYRSVVATFAPDVGTLRRCPHARQLLLGNFVSSIGTQASLVALPYQLFVLTGSAALTGLVGAAEVVPMVAATLGTGVLCDRLDRRGLLLAVQVALIGGALGLAATAMTASPSIAVIYALAALKASAVASQNVIRTSMLPRLAPREDLPAVLSLNAALSQLSVVVGPAGGGLLIGVTDVSAVYFLDALSCLAVVLAGLKLAATPPRGENRGESAWQAVQAAVGFVRRSPPLLGSLSIDAMAMTLAMPRALFPILSLSVFGTGSAGAGLLFAAVAVGATAATAASGWVRHVTRPGRVVVGAVVAWGLAVASLGSASTLWWGALCLVVAGAADGVSTIARSIMNRMATPDDLRGRVTSLYTVSSLGAPRMGDVEAGLLGGALGPGWAITGGGLACAAGAGLLAFRLPAFWRYELEPVRDSATGVPRRADGGPDA